MALPNVTGVQQAGVDPLSVQKKGDNSQAIANALRDVQTRLDNTMNVRGNIQAGVYGAFGNNFLSRGMIGITDAITDSISALFDTQEAEPEDPVSKAIKQQTAILQEVSNKLDDSNKTTERTIDEIVLLRKDIKHNHELDHADVVEQDGILEKILVALNTSSQQTPVQREEKISERARRRKVPTSTDVASKRTPVYDVPPQVTLPGQTEIKQLPPQQAEQLTTATQIDNQQDKTAPEQSAPDKLSGKDEVKESDRDDRDSKKDGSKSLLKKILDVLGLANKNLEKLVKAEPMSTRAAELEAMRVKRDQLEKRTGVEDIKTVEEGGKRGFDWSRLFTGLLDFDANIRGFKNVFGFVIDAMKSGISGLMGVLSPIIGLISKLGTAIASVLATVATKAVSGAATLASAGVSIAKKAMPYAIPAAIMGGVGAAVDYGAGKLGVGGKEIDETQDEQNWAKMGFLEKLESGTARGIEKVGSFLSLDNLANEARASRIKSETEYLRKKTGTSEGLNQIEVTQGDLRKLDRLKETQQTAGQAPVVQDNRVTQNQTIMPTRTVVENPESSYRRYLNNILSPGR